MRSQVRHRWESVALSGGASLCATHGSLVCGDGEHRYDVTSYRSGGKVYTTFMVYNVDGTCPSGFAHEFVSDRAWGNCDIEAALVRFCESRDGGMRSDGSVRDDWGGFVRFVAEMTDEEGEDIYGSPVVTAMRWLPFDSASNTVKAAERGDMDQVGPTDGDHGGDHGGDNAPLSDDSWEIWLWHDSDEHVPLIPSMTVYGHVRLFLRSEALDLWEDCKTNRPDVPKMLVHLSNDRLCRVEDISGLTVNVGTGVEYGGSL